MLVDLHCHTLPLSTCSSLRPEQLLEQAVARGLDAVCLTEHDRAWDHASLDALRAATSVTVFSAVELTTDLGHVLAFGLREQDFSAVASDLFARAEARGGLLFLAHPARDGLLRVSRATVEYFASVEACNGSDSRMQNLAAAGLATGFRLPGIGGSDAHALHEVGRAATRFRRQLGTDADLLAALREGAYTAVALD